MKNDSFLLAATSGIAAAAALLLSRAYPAVLTADSLVGFAVVAMLVVIGALDYRISTRDLARR